MKRNGSGPMRITSLFFQASFPILSQSQQHPIKPGEEYMSCLNILTDEMMGYVEVPKINIKIPIFHTTSEEVLSKRSRSSGRKFPSGRWREYPFCNLCTPWSSKCQSFHRPGSAGRRRSFSRSVYWIRHSATKWIRSISWNRRIPVIWQWSRDRIW